MLASSSAVSSIVEKLLVIARLLSSVSGGSSSNKQFSRPAICAKRPFSLQVMKMWAMLSPQMLSASVTAPMLSGLLPERAKEMSSTFFSGEK